MEPLVVAQDDRWLSAFGVEPRAEQVTGDDFVRELRFAVDSTDEVILTWDAINSSVRVRLVRADNTVVDLYRDYATRLVPEVDGSARTVLIEYEAGDWSDGFALMWSRPSLSTTRCSGDRRR
jgi:hypothetical protein